MLLHPSDLSLSHEHHIYQKRKPYFAGYIILELVRTVFLTCRLNHFEPILVLISTCQRKFIANGESIMRNKNVMFQCEWLLSLMLVGIPMPLFLYMSSKLLASHPPKRGLHQNCFYRFTDTNSALHKQHWYLLKKHSALSKFCLSLHKNQFSTPLALPTPCQKPTQHCINTANPSTGIQITVKADATGQVLVRRRKEGNSDIH